jgi:hypothetical protein
MSETGNVPAAERRTAISFLPAGLARTAAKHRNVFGFRWTAGYGDLQRWTAVDGLPLDGMQEVWGSNPHSSTCSTT